MFLGHYGIALAAKKAAPKASLGILVLAAQLADLLWPIFLLLGWEQVRIEPGNTRVTPLNFVSYPYSHSLVSQLLWGVALGGLYFAFRKDARGATVAAICVPTHWLLDYVVHRPDMPIYPGGSALWPRPVEFPSGYSGGGTSSIRSRHCDLHRRHTSEGSHRPVCALVTAALSCRGLLRFDPWTAAAQCSRPRCDRARPLANRAVGRLGRPPPRNNLKRARFWPARPNRGFDARGTFDSNMSGVVHKHARTL